MRFLLTITLLISIASIGHAETLIVKRDLREVVRREYKELKKEKNDREKALFEKEDFAFEEWVEPTPHLKHDQVFLEQTHTELLKVYDDIKELHLLLAETQEEAAILVIESQMKRLKNEANTLARNLLNSDDRPDRMKVEFSRGTLTISGTEIHYKGHNSVRSIETQLSLGLDKLQITFIKRKQHLNGDYKLVSKDVQTLETVNGQTLFVRNTLLDLRLGSSILNRVQYVQLRTAHEQSALEKTVEKMKLITDNSILRGYVSDLIED